MSILSLRGRRNFLRGAAAACGGAWLAACSAETATSVNREESAEKAGNATEDISPAEDLMREHGVLKRVLLIYRDAMGKIDAGKDFPPDVLTGCADLIRNFIENYHEKLEEEQLFPRFRKANTLVDLVDVLYAQHQKGRILTDTILRLSAPASFKNSDSKLELHKAMDLFIRMYEPHEAREDTVLFPALRSIVSPQEYDALGEEFEDKEHQLFGEDGFEKNVEEVARLEKIVGIYDLAQFTPAI